MAPKIAAQSSDNSAASTGLQIGRYRSHAIHGAIIESYVHGEYMNGCFD